MSITFDLVAADEIPIAHAIELSGFPLDESATLEQFQQRQSNAPDLFLGAYIPDSSSKSHRKLVGYVCSTLATGESLTHETMSEHVPSGTSVCIHAVCIAKEHQRKGVAVSLLKEYLSRLEEDGRYQRALLITHEELRSLYEKAGFEWIGKSSVVHGSRPWYEMRKVLKAEGAKPAVQEGLPPGLWEALQGSSKRTRPSARPLSAFSSVEEVAEVSAATKSNRYDLLCPREGCGSIILKNGVACLVQKDFVELEPQGHPPASLLTPLPSPSEKFECWLVRPNAMAFENIGFSKAMEQSSEGPRKKLLSCADCDLGPLGWCYEGGSDFWLICSRVGYRV